MRDCVPVKPEDHWSFDSKAEQANKRRNKRLNEASASLANALALLGSIHKVARR
jgi:hypothetical protein